jgi:hypothetical protein
VLSRFLSPFREFGALAGSLYAADRVLQRLSPRLRVYAYDLVVQPLRADPVPAGYEFREIRRGDPDVELMPARPDIKAQRFDHGAFCLGAYRGGKLVGFAWFKAESYDEDEARCTYVLPPGTVFDFDVYVFPQYRMGRAFAALWAGASAFLRDRGVRATCSRIAMSNVTSMRAHARLGARRVGRATFLQLGPAQITVATVAPYVSLGSPRIALEPDA